MVTAKEEAILKEIIKEHETKKLNKELEEKRRMFNEAKEKAFKELRLKQDVELQELGKEWEAKEKN